MGGRQLSDAGPPWRALVADAVAAGVDPDDLRWIGREASGRSGAEWAAGLDDPSTAITHARFTAMVERRLGGEPLQYVLGSWGFRSLDLLVDRRVLIPRPETEWVVEVAMPLLPADGDAVVADLGTGSGAIGLSIAAERWPRVRVLLTDASADALAVARANLAGLGRAGTRVEVHEGSWWSALPDDLRGRFDLVVSNPPYVAPADDLPPEVADWEPASALVPGPTGLESLEEILGAAGAWLRPGGWIVCEIGETQGDAVLALATTGGLVEAAIHPDLTGRDRMVVARRPPE